MGKSHEIEYEGEGNEITWKDSYPTTDDDSSSSVPAQPAAARSPSRCTTWVKRIVFAVILVVILAVGLSIAFLGRANPIEFFVQEDPPGRNETHEWRTNGNNGLEILIENALEDRWTPILDEYVEKWDAGYSDVKPLALSVRRVAEDFHCDPTPGRLKVCNGDYGATDWRGINIVLLQNGWIAHSVAKLNDYWLDKEGTFQQRYTMCHELGHGFGLAHTDESYWNINTGECMDYTTRVRSNLNPGAFNFDLLASIYGSTTASVVPEGTITQENQSGGKPSNRRRLGQVIGDIAVPDDITSKYYKAVNQIEGMVCRDCLVDLGNGYQLEVHQLGVE